MIKILYNLFKVVLTINSLLFDINTELIKNCLIASTEKDSIQIQKEDIEKNYKERMDYISIKLVQALDKAKNSPSSPNSHQKEKSQVSSDFIEKGIEKLCQQNIDLRRTIKKKNEII